MRSSEEILNQNVLRERLLSKACQQASIAIKEVRPEALRPPICISRRLGAGGREVAALLCARLDYILAGKNMLDDIARDLNIQRKLIDNLDETTENNLKLMWETYVHGRELAWDEYQVSLFRVIRAIASQGGVVFLGRGASYILQAESALNVFITAPLEKRVERIMQYEKITSLKARERAVENDQRLERFHKKTFKSYTGMAMDFDLCLNTSRLNPEAAVELILQALVLRGVEVSKLSPVHHLKTA